VVRFDAPGGSSVAPAREILQLVARRWRAVERRTDHDAAPGE
jgi:hypothetical protein